MNDNRDLLDLCRLNLMEENIKESVSVDRDITLQAIDYKKRQMVERIKNDPSPVASDAVEKHIERQL